MIREQEVTTVPGLAALFVLLAFMLFSGYASFGAFQQRDVVWGLIWAFVTDDFWRNLPGPSRGPFPSDTR